jgi:glutamate dehydrogenase (NADP+)
MSDLTLNSISLDAITNLVKERDPDQTEFQQAVHEVMQSVIPFVKENEKYQRKGLLERLVEPERMVMFRVPWEDDEGNYRLTGDSGFSLTVLWGRIKAG